MGREVASVLAVMEGWIAGEMGGGRLVLTDRAAKGGRAWVDVYGWGECAKSFQGICERGGGLSRGTRALWRRGWCGESAWLPRPGSCCVRVCYCTFGNAGLGKIDEAMCPLNLGLVLP
jgi:hypothetical protein